IRASPDSAIVISPLGAEGSDRIVTLFRGVIDRLQSGSAIYLEDKSVYNELAGQVHLKLLNLVKLPFAKIKREDFGRIAGKIHYFETSKEKKSDDFDDAISDALEADSTPLEKLIASYSLSGKYTTPVETQVNLLGFYKYDKLVRCDNLEINS